MPDTGITPQYRMMEFLDETGHTSFGWEPDNDEWVLPLIKLKMAQGYQFWIVKRTALGGSREVRLRSVEAIGPTRRVMIKDDDARRLFDQGRIGLHVSPPRAGAEDYVFERRATTAEEAVRADTVMQRPMRGG